MRFSAISIVLLAMLPLPAWAADPIADPASPVGIAGQFIVDAAGGQSYEDAYARTRSDYNPYGIDLDALVAKLGLAKLSEDGTGAAIAAGELSILPQFNTPWGKFSFTAETPPTVPFTFLQDGRCEAGYAVGFPFPQQVFVADIGDAPCSAYAVEDKLFAAYRAIEKAPKGLSDADLEAAMRAAYTAAAAYSSAHGNYFARDGVFAPLRDAVAAGLLGAGFSTLVVPAEPAAGLAAARACLAAPGTELRIALNASGDGLSLVAVTDARDYIYHYDPHEAPDINVTAAEACLAPG